MNNVTKLKDNLLVTDTYLYKIEVLVPDDILYEVLTAITNQKVTPSYWRVDRA